MPDWYYQDAKERVVGPLRGSDLLNLIRGGEVTELTLVRKDNSAWVSSVQINGLWTAASRPQTQFQCPLCSHNISKPPTRCPNCLKYVDQATGKLKKSGVSASQIRRIREAATQPESQSNSTDNQPSGSKHKQNEFGEIPSQIRSSKPWLRRLFKR